MKTVKVAKTHQSTVPRSWAVRATPAVQRATILTFWLPSRLAMSSTEISVKSEDKDVNGEIIHKGISQRQFARSFTIADDVKVGGAELKDGLLTIACERIVPEYKKKKLIEIK